LTNPADLQENQEPMIQPVLSTTAPLLAQTVLRPAAVAGRRYKPIGERATDHG
jgi:hypothetical protein